MVALTFAVALLVAVLVAGAWEIRRLEHDVHALQADGGSATQIDHALRSLSALSRLTTKVRESDLRLEFQLPLGAYLTDLVIAVDAGHLACATAKQRWQNYVNDKLIPFVNRPQNRNLKMALQHDDPDYHATLLNAFVLSC